jgi:hypothetical protein
MIQKIFLAAALTILTPLANAESEPWKAVILTASEEGWFENRGTATASDDLKKIIVKNEAGRTLETYTGSVKGDKWTGTRSVNQSDNTKEPLQGRLSRRKIGLRKFETLILSNQWVSANFIRVTKN